jgi:hypothetical protein
VTKTALAALRRPDLREGFLGLRLVSREKIKETKCRDKDTKKKINKKEIPGEVFGCWQG